MKLKKKSIKKKTESTWVNPTNSGDDTDITL